MMLALEKYFGKNKKNKKTTERIYIPSLLLDYDFAAAGSLDVEAVVALLPGFGEGTGSGEESFSSSSASSTWQIKEI